MTWEALAALAGVAAAFAAAWQLYSIRVDARSRRAAEINSVAVITTVVERPRPDQVRDGRARWIYEYGLNNPGALPISNVEVRINYPCEVQRQHSSGSLEPVTREDAFHVPVLGPGAVYAARRRSLLIAEADWPGLERTTGFVITFTTPDAGRCRTEWPHLTNTRIDNKLRKLVRRAPEQS